jgi:imidazolonepropionase-like amidohydrolase
MNCSIVPGFVDSHTHPVWVGDRINEFKKKVNINKHSSNQSTS